MARCRSCSEPVGSHPAECGVCGLGMCLVAGRDRSGWLLEHPGQGGWAAEVGTGLVTGSLTSPAVSHSLLVAQETHANNRNEMRKKFL